MSSGKRTVVLLSFIILVVIIFRSIVMPFILWIAFKILNAIKAAYGAFVWLNGPHQGGAMPILCFFVIIVLIFLLILVNVIAKLKR